MRFVALGHVANDRLDGGLVPGGSALYAALAAAELGAQARIVTSAGPDFVGGELLDAAGVEVDVAPAPTTTCFENLYRAGIRQQRLLSLAEPITRPVDRAEVVFACPIAGEVAASALVAPQRAVLGASLQGWLRAVDAQGRVHRRIPEDLGFLAPCHVLFVSEEDLGEEAEQVIETLGPLAELVVVTEGARGGRVYVDGVVQRYDAVAVEEVDPTGAGDVFAAAFLVAVASRQSPAAAARFAARAASIVVTAPGPAALPVLRTLRLGSP
jgi:sugar/nucleoside kinase (ribokinase family)